MTDDSAQAQNGRFAFGPRKGAALGAGLILGAVLFDLVVFLGAGEPEVFLDLVPGSVFAILIGAFLGGWMASSRLFVAAFWLLLLAGSLATELSSFGVSEALMWLPRMGFLLCSAWIVGRWLHGRRRWSMARSALALGFGCGVVALAYRSAFEMPPRFDAIAMGTLGLLVLAELRWPVPRRLATLAVVGAALWPTLRLVPMSQRPSRPDTALPPMKPADSARNLLFVVLDTVRADHLAPYGYSRITTPALDAFVREHATRYSRATSASSWTLPSHATLFTGLPPGVHQATTSRTASGDAIHLATWPGQPLDPGFPTLAEYMEEAGYATGAILGNCYFLRLGFGLDRGFQRYDVRAGAFVFNHLAVAQLTGRRLYAGHRAYRAADSITDRALDWLPDSPSERPFFLFLNYFDAHHPYLPHPPYDRAFDEAQPLNALEPERELEALVYDRELLGMDAALARLLGGLQERGLFDETAIIITADHGESLGDHGFPKHNWSLYEEVIHVPLYVKPAGGRELELIEAPIRGREVFELALELVGQSVRPDSLVAREAEQWTMAGEWYHCGDSRPELLASMEERTGFTLDRDLLSWIEQGVKYIVCSKGTVEAYDLSVDPDEVAPLTLPPEQVADARERAFAWWREHPPTSSAAPELTVTAEDLERLEAVGYAGE